MVIKPMIRNNICMNAHPLGCYKDVESQIKYVKAKGPYAGPKKVLVIGASTGFGLASRISLAFGAGADTFGVAFEKEASATKPGTMGWYNTQSFDILAKKAGLIAESLNADAFSSETKIQVVSKIKALFGTVDLVVYSLASPVRTDPVTGDVYRSTLKPIGKTFTAKSINPQSGEIKETTIDPASEDEIRQTVKVMGGEDWELWLEALLDGGALSKNAVTVAYSYIGPEVTRAVYRDGTIGKAKEHLEKSAAGLTAKLSSINGKAFVSVNKALVTRASAVIPVVPLYLALLFKVMKAKGIHEGCIEQMDRLYRGKLYTGKGTSEAPVDVEGRIRMDDWEMRDDVQSEISGLWSKVTTENLSGLGDMEGYNHDFLAIHGFGRDDVDYDAEINTLYPIEQ